MKKSPPKCEEMSSKGCQILHAEFSAPEHCSPTGVIFQFFSVNKTLRCPGLDFQPATLEDDSLIFRAIVM